MHLLEIGGRLETVLLLVTLAVLVVFWWHFRSGARR
jgi:hypothetical protein